jgi:hypothetical protein
METESGREPEEEGPKRKALSMEDLRKKYPWWPSNSGAKGPATLTEMEPLSEEGTVAQGGKSTRL